MADVENRSIDVEETNIEETSTEEVEKKEKVDIKKVLLQAKTKLTTNTSVKGLVLKSIIYMIIPYVYIFVCGLIFDLLLKWYFMTTFIFVSMCILWILAIVLIIISIINYRKMNKKKEAE